MGLFERLWGYRKLGALSEIGPGRVEVEGEVEALSELAHPLSGEGVVALEYYVSPPSDLSVNVTGIAERAFTVEATQGVDFVLTDGSHRVLILVAEGAHDISTVHQHLLKEYGTRLRPKVLAVRAGDRVCVRGVAEPRSTESPYRSVEYLAVIRARRFWMVPA